MEHADWRIAQDGFGRGLAVRDFALIYKQRTQQLAQTDYETRDKEAIARFLTNLEAQGVGDRRLCKYIGHFVKLRKLITKPLVDFTGEEIDELLKTINKHPKWSAWTRHDYQLCLKKFYRFVDGSENRSGRIKILTPATKLFDESKALTEEDVQKLERATPNIREKTMVRLLFETGARVSEFLSLKVEDAQEHPPFILFHVHGTKNAYADRKIPVNNPYAIRLFKEYLQTHPTASNPQSPLWLNAHDQPMEERNFSKQLVELGKKAGVSKKLNPHWFRHSRVTHLRSKGITQLENFFGWCKGSDMLRTYDHSGLDALLSDLSKNLPPQDDANQIDDAILESILKVILRKPEFKKEVLQELKLNGAIKRLEGKKM